MSIQRIFTDLEFTRVQRYLKLSKSGSEDNGPYWAVTRDNEPWYEIRDANGLFVGQCPREALE